MLINVKDNIITGYKKDKHWVNFNSNKETIEIPDQEVYINYSEYINGAVILNENKYIKHKSTRENRLVIKQEMASIQRWLKDNDYIINKHTLGEYEDTDSRWLNYLEERKQKLAKYNELEKTIKIKES